MEADARKPKLNQEYNTRVDMFFKEHRAKMKGCELTILQSIKLYDELRILDMYSHSVGSRLA